MGKAGFELLIRGDGLCRADFENMLAGIGAEFGISGDLECRREVWVLRMLD